jgi:hypothetical protein
MLCRSCKGKEDKRKAAFYARDPEASKEAHDTYVAKEKHKRYEFVFLIKIRIIFFGKQHSQLLLFCQLLCDDLTHFKQHI